ncbi:uncharacterized protein LOC101852640 [Aplysia californica]|uniref:Uncharacterized protein LOC101852640 n=1 Tax=Aplysia californica TaxID=6500 RepID=A0ABM1A5L2_APLCA|nr:uncharacterized protein LOC101852640 [Aplysia californica]XP_012941271.1 uncharacterized protein LOC101852640 [Aplysia californica]
MAGSGWRIFLCFLSLTSDMTPTHQASSTPGIQLSELTYHPTCGLLHNIGTWSMVARANLTVLNSINWKYPSLSFQRLHTDRRDYQTLCMIMFKRDVLADDGSFGCYISKKNETGGFLEATMNMMARLTMSNMTLSVAFRATLTTVDLTHYSNFRTVPIIYDLSKATLEFGGVTYRLEQGIPNSKLLVGQTYNLTFCTRNLLKPFVLSIWDVVGGSYESQDQDCVHSYNMLISRQHLKEAILFKFAETVGCMRTRIYAVYVGQSSSKAAPGPRRPMQSGRVAPWFLLCAIACLLQRREPLRLPGPAGLV